MSRSRRKTPCIGIDHAEQGQHRHLVDAQQPLHGAEQVMGRRVINMRKANDREIEQHENRLG